MEKFRLFIESSLGFYFDTSSYSIEAAKLHDGVLPEGGQGQDFAKRFWDAMMEISGGNMELLQKMNEQFGKSALDDNEAHKKSQLFIASSLEI